MRFDDTKTYNLTTTKVFENLKNHDGTTRYPREALDRQRFSPGKVGVLTIMDKFLVRTYDRKPMKVKKTVQKKMRQSTLHACKKVVIIENVASLKHELDDIIKVLIPRNVGGSQEKPSGTSSDNVAVSAGGLGDKEGKFRLPQGNEVDATEKKSSDENKIDIERLVRRSSSILDELEAAFISLETLEKTGLGRTVNMFAKRKSKHPYDTLLEKASKLVKKWKEKVEEGSDRRKRHRNVRKPVVSKHVETSTSNSYGTSGHNISNRSGQHRSKYHDRYRNSLSSLDFRRFGSQAQEKRFLDSQQHFLSRNTTTSGKKRKHEDSVESNQVKRRLTHEQLERIKRNKELALQKLNAKRRASTLQGR